MTKVEKFLKRIGLRPDTKIEHTYDFLKLIQYNCVLTIPYENLDILRGKAISLAPDDIFEKIVEQGRGGFCFELNALLSWFFKEVGFEVKDYFARYLRGETALPMRRHRILVVKCAEGEYMCDIGVGQIAPKYPLLLAEGLVQSQFDEQYKFERDAFLGWVLYDLSAGKWREYIAFTEEAQLEVDFVQPTFYCEKHPQSVFNKAYMITIKTPTGRKTIDDRVYKEFTGEALSYIEENLSDARRNALLEKEFYLKNI